MKPALRIAVLLLLFGCTLARCQDRKDLKGVLQVVAEGAGQNRDEAIKDALRNAVRQAIGTFVDTVSQVENDRVIKDSILLYSDGFVEKFEVIPGSDTTSAGIFRVTIQADVKRKALSDSLVKSKLRSASIDGESLFAEATTKHEAEKNAEALAIKLFRDFPERYLIANAGNPRIVTQTATAATCEIEVEITIDQELYADFHGRMYEFLEEVASKRKRLSAQFEKMSGTTDGVDRFALKKSEDFRIMLGAVKQLNVIALGHPTKKPSERIDFTFFEIEEHLHRVFRQIPAIPGEFRLEFLDGSDEVVYDDRLSERAFYSSIGCPWLNLAVYSMAHGGKFNYYDARRDPTPSSLIVISPSFLDGNFQDSLLHRPTRRVLHKVEVPLDALKKTKRIRVQCSYEDQFGE